MDSGEIAASWENQQFGLGTGPTQTGLCTHIRWLETGNFGFKKKRNCTIRVAKTKTLISFTVTVKLICVFVFAYADCWFSHEGAQIFKGNYGFDKRQSYMLWFNQETF